ncbi:MAG: hypothetical protein AAF290_11315 [Pseudomonadota bacterium]
MSATPGCDVYVRVLSDFGVWWRGQPVTLPRSRKTRALLAYLIVEAREVSRRKLSDVFFPSTNDPRGNLRWSVSLLRATFKEIDPALIQSTRSTISIRSDRIISDLQLLATASDEEIQSAPHAPPFGKFLPGFDTIDTSEFVSWHAASDALYAAKQIERLRRLVTNQATIGATLEYAEKWVVLAPEDERAWVQLVEAIAASGQVSSAKQLRTLVEARMRRFGLDTSGLLIAATKSRWPSNVSESSINHDSDRTRNVTVEVLPVRFLGADSDDGPLLYQVIRAAASMCKLYSVLDNTYQDTKPDLQISASILSVANGARLEASLISMSTGETLYDWRAELPADERDWPAAMETFCCRRFEIDIPIAMATLTAKEAKTEYTALEHYLLALPLIYGAVGYRSQEASERLELALGADPDFSQALCALAWVRSAHPSYNQSSAALAESEQFVRRSVEHGHDDAFVLAWASITILHVAKDLETATDWAARALLRNRHSAMANLAKAYIEHYRTEFQQSITTIDQYAGLGDAEPLTYLFYTVKSMLLYQYGDSEQAVIWAQRAVGRNPSFIIAVRALAASLVQAGRLPEARAIVDRLELLDASEYLAFFRARLPYSHNGPIEKLCKDLAKAGVKEGL